MAAKKVTKKSVGKTEVSKPTKGNPAKIKEINDAHKAKRKNAWPEDKKQTIDKTSDFKPIYPNSNPVKNLDIKTEDCVGCNENGDKEKFEANMAMFDDFQMWLRDHKKIKLVVTEKREPNPDERDYIVRTPLSELVKEYDTFTLNK